MEGGSDNLKVWMLILHGSSDIFMPHCRHHRRQIAGIAKDPRSRNRVVRIHEEILGELSLPACESELLSQVHPMTTP